MASHETMEEYIKFLNETNPLPRPEAAAEQPPAAGSPAPGTPIETAPDHSTGITHPAVKSRSTFTPGVDGRTPTSR